MENQNNKLAVRSFAGNLAAAVSESLAQATGSPWPLEIVDAQELAPRNAQPVQFRLKLEGALRGECFIEFYEPQASELATMLTSRNAEAQAVQPGKALVEVISSAAAAFNTTLASRHGELSFKVDSVSGIAFGGMSVVQLSGPSTASVRFYFDGELVEALASAQSGEAHSEPSDHSPHSNNLKLVMDVELNVTLRFGQRQLPLREVLDLTSGSVIELDRMVDEPVELLLDGKLVARGEAVIVDGNYGLRVTEIPQAVASHFLH
jgi:flagellar motor switch protein FliN/FliY